MIVVDTDWGFYPLKEAMMLMHLGFKWLESSRRRAFAYIPLQVPRRFV